MAENRNITWNIKLVINDNVTSRYTLKLQDARLNWGKWDVNPPAEIRVPIGQKEVKISFRAMGQSCSATGTEGTVTYVGDDPERTNFTLKWDIPYSTANYGGVTGGSNYYDLKGGRVPASGSSVTADLELRQTKPTI